MPNPSLDAGLPPARSRYASPVDFALHGEYAAPRIEGVPLHQFDGRIRADGSTPFAPAPGRYHFYLSVGCPYSHRIAIILNLLGLGAAISHSLVDDLRDGRGWAFRPARGPDPVNGFAFLAQAYEASRRGFVGHVSCPTLWDRETGQVVSNDSGTIVLDLLTQFGEIATEAPDLYPQDIQAEIDALSRRILDEVGTAAYFVGFAKEQADYAAKVEALFATLDELEARLGRGRYLFGDRLTESDVRLWVILARFDIAYNPLFRANLRRIVDYPNLWAYARDLYGLPAFRTLSDFAAIKAVYWRMFPALNPSGVVPLGPLLDWRDPSPRESVGH